MTERAEPMTPAAVAELLTDSVEAATRNDRVAIEAAMDRLFLQGLPEDGLRFLIGGLHLLASMMSPAQTARVLVAERRAEEKPDVNPGELLCLRMLADVISGDDEAAMERWIDAMLADEKEDTGAPGWAIGVMVRQAASLVRASRATLQ